jgi:branched-chain amino acid transport system permease protein
MSENSRMLPRGPVGWAGLAVALAALAAMPYLVSAYYVGLATKAMIAAMLALSLHLLVGGTGLVSLGHGAFFGLAAYVVYLMSPESAPRPIWQTLPAAMAIAAAVALIVGALSLRAKGFFFLMVTLAFGQMIFFVFHDAKLGGGTDGAYLGKPALSLLGLELDPQSLPRSKRGWPAYYVALAQLAAMYLLLVLLLRSLLGRVLEGIRVNEHRMAALGFNTYAYKLVAFTVAGALAGAGGHMWSLHTGFVNPELVGWHKSAEALLMILLGGIGSLAGAIVGAFALTALGEIAQVAGGQLAAFGSSLGEGAAGQRLVALGRILGERKLLIEGIVILATVLCLRHGIMGIFAGRSDDRDHDGENAAANADLLRQSAAGDVHVQAETVGAHRNE